MDSASSTSIGIMATKRGFPVPIPVSTVCSPLIPHNFPKLQYRRLTRGTELDLPEYETYETLRERLYTAMTAGGEYFGFA